MSRLSEVKRFKIIGVLRKRGEDLPFKKEFRALRKEDALQNLYADLGSRHKARRFEVKVKTIEELPVEAENA